MTALRGMSFLMGTRGLRIVVGVCLITLELPFLCVLESCQLAAGQSGHTLKSIDSMHESRANHTATVLPDGRVLIVGGSQKDRDGRSQIYLRTAELFDPGTRTFHETGSMTVGRAGHSAILLPRGTVLVIGGMTDGGMTPTAELYDPNTGLFSQAGAMTDPRSDFTATTLPGGDILITGGGNGRATASAELYHPTTGLFSITGPMTTPRMGHTATLLPNGKVLIVGGASEQRVNASTELYDPAFGSFKPAASMHRPRYRHAAILLDDGHTLILGGTDNPGWRGQDRSAEVYDWKFDRFTLIANMVHERFRFPAAVVPLDSGKVLLCGGSSVIEVFNYVTKSFECAGHFDQPYYSNTASVLHDHSVLIAGGYANTLLSTAGAWIFRK